MIWAQKQNQDGGWGYGRGTSWTEPTVFALLAQSATGLDKQIYSKGLDFLYTLQNADGGWRPQHAVRESTWITSVVSLLPEVALGPGRAERARNWLSSQTGMESGWRWKLSQRMAGNKEEFPDGWPWFPGAAAWVIPTSFGVLAFEKALKQRADSKWKERVEAGRKFLLMHMCADGGWNHGGNKALGRDGDSYPETTGIALLALHGAGPSPQLEKAKTAARKHLESCKTAEGTAWLRIGLAAHGIQLKPAIEPTCRTNLDLALTAIAGAERNPLLA